MSQVIITRGGGGNVASVILSFDIVLWAVPCSVCVLFRCWNSMQIDLANYIVYY